MARGDGWLANGRGRPVERVPRPRDHARCGDFAAWRIYLTTRARRRHQPARLLRPRAGWRARRRSFRRRATDPQRDPLCGRASMQPNLPEVDPLINFPAARITAAGARAQRALRSLLSGRDQPASVLPSACSEPPDQKRQIISDGGHFGAAQPADRRIARPGWTTTSVRSRRHRLRVGRVDSRGVPAWATSTRSRSKPLSSRAEVPRRRFQLTGTAVRAATPPAGGARDARRPGISPAASLEGAQKAALALVADVERDVDHL